MLLHGGLVLQLNRPGNGDGLRTMVLVSMVRGPQALVIVRTPHDKETMSSGCHHLTAANGISAVILQRY
jgi:hypothetical protein